MQKEKIWKFDRILILIFVIFFTFRPSLKSTALFISWARLISVSAQSWKFANFKCDLWSFYVLTSWIKKLFRAIVLAIYHSVSLIAKYTLKNPSLKNVPFLEECFILFTSVCKLYMHNFTINFAKWSVFKMVISNTHKRIKCLLKKRDTNRDTMFSLVPVSYSLHLYVGDNNKVRSSHCFKKEKDASYRINYFSKYPGL